VIGEEMFELFQFLKDADKWLDYLILLLPFLLLLGTFYPGKASSWTWSATSQPMDKVDLSFPAEIIPTTNFTSSGYQSNEAGIFACKGTVEGPYNSSLGLTQGQSISMVFALGGGGSSFTITFRVADIRLSTATSNAVARASVSIESNGSFSVTF
jgi:hypothetical protein